MCARVCCASDSRLCGDLDTRLLVSGRWVQLPACSLEGGVMRAPLGLVLLSGSVSLWRGVRGLTNDLRGNNTYRPTRGTSDGPCVVRAGVWDACGELGRLVSRHRGVLLRGRGRAVRGRCLAGPGRLRWVGSPSGWQWSRSAGPWVSVQIQIQIVQDSYRYRYRYRSCESDKKAATD